MGYVIYTADKFPIYTKDRYLVETNDNYSQININYPLTVTITQNTRPVENSAVTYDINLWQDIPENVSVVLKDANGSVDLFDSTILFNMKNNFDTAYSIPCVEYDDVPLSAGGTFIPFSEEILMPGTYVGQFAVTTNGVSLIYPSNKYISIKIWELI